MNTETDQLNRALEEFDRFYDGIDDKKKAPQSVDPRNLAFVAYMEGRRQAKDEDHATARHS